MPEYNTLPAGCQPLVDASPTGKPRPWAEHKQQASILAAAYLEHDPMKAARVLNCAEQLNFTRGEDGHLRLADARFCRVRLCPVCQWRRSLKVYGQAADVVRYLAQQRAAAHRKPYSYIMLTLTLRNIPGEILPASLSEMSHGWQRLTQRAEYRAAVVGSMRAIEVTYNAKAETYHPHIHAILAVLPSYWHSSNYILQARWASLWAEANRLDYDPVCDVRRCYGSTDSAIAEVAKYAAKPGDYIDPADVDRMSEIVAVLDTACAKRRFVSWGGVMHDAHKALGLDDAETGDLVHVDSSSTSDGGQLLRFDWWPGIRLYLRYNNGFAERDSNPR